MPAPTDILDGFLPEYDINEIHDIWVPVAPDRALSAIRAVTAREVRLLGPFMAIRSLPRLLARKSSEIDGGRPILAQFVEQGFTSLDVQDDGFALGAIGKFWRPIGNSPVPGVSGGEGFNAFEQPGFAKAAMSFEAKPENGGARITTETRVRSTSRGARWRFRVYWALIGLGSALIRRSWLKAIARRIRRETT